MRLPRAVLPIVTIALPLLGLAVPAAAAVSTDGTVAPDGSTAKTVYVIAYRDRCDGGVDVGLANAAAVGSAPIPFSINGETVVLGGRQEAWHTVTLAETEGKRVKIQIAAYNPSGQVDKATHVWAKPATGCGPIEINEIPSASPSASASGTIGGTAIGGTASASASAHGAASGSASGGSGQATGGVNAADPGGLPVTGPKVGLLVLVSGVLCAAGISTIFFLRRRRLVFRA
jgi:hypothetical protein